MEHLALNSTGILHPNHDAGEQVLKDSRWCKKVTRADLAHIVQHRFTTFRTVDTIPNNVRFTIREEIVTDPSHWQIGQYVSVCCELIPVRSIGRSLDQALVTQNNPFGISCCTRGIENAGNITALAFVYFIRKERRILAFEIFTLLLNRFKINQKILRIVPHASWITVNDELQFRASVHDFEQLVDLLLVFCNCKTHLSVFNHKL